MRICPIAFMMIVLVCAACKGGRQHDSYTPADSLDSVATAVADSMEIHEEPPLPEAADELFDDFFFNFAASKKLQQERTVFPLPVEEAGETSYIEKKQWKTEPFFIKEDFYTLIFDSPQQMALVKDTTVNHVTVEHIMLMAGEVNQYVFDRQAGLWRLVKLCHQQLNHNPNAQFLKFYQNFATDSAFQHRSLASQMAFVGPDPDDDFKMIEGVITPDFWDAFAPEFPQNYIYNIVYGQQNPAAMQKIFVIRGISNGLEVEVTFKLQHGRWKVTKLIT